MREHFNKKEIIEKLLPVVENTAMRYNLIPLEVSLEKENEKLVAGFKKLNRVCIKSTNCNIFINIMIKVVIFSILSLIF